MINRKCIKRTVNDIIELLVFVGREKANFPIAMMKTKANGTRCNSLGGIYPDDLECLQHISELMTHEETAIDDDNTGEINDRDVHNADILFLH